MSDRMESSTEVLLRMFDMAAPWPHLRQAIRLTLRPEEAETASLDSDELRKAVERDARMQDALDALQAAVLSEHGHLNLGESWYRKARSGIVGLRALLSAGDKAEAPPT